MANSEGRVKKDSVAGNHVDVGVAFLTERPNLPRRGDVINEESDPAAASCTLDVHAQDFVLLSEKGGINPQTASRPF